MTLTPTTCSDSSRSEIGTTLLTNGEATLIAGNNLTARAASVTSSAGALTARAGNDLSITAGESAAQVDEAHQHKEKGFLSRKTRTIKGS